VADPDSILVADSQTGIYLSVDFWRSGINRKIKIPEWYFE
jgi:hypothetical protein